VCQSDSTEKGCITGGSVDGAVLDICQGGAGVQTAVAGARCQSWAHRILWCRYVWKIPTSDHEDLSFSMLQALSSEVLHAVYERIKSWLRRGRAFSFDSGMKMTMFPSAMPCITPIVLTVTIICNWQTQRDRFMAETRERLRFFRLICTRIIVRVLSMKTRMLRRESTEELILKIDIPCLEVDLFQCCKKMDTRRLCDA
jgi:hypothetical protein